MSFDWMSFATGFLETTGDIYETRKEEAKTYEEEQRAAAERNAQLIARRRAIADQVTGYANYLRSNGATDEQIQAAISSGPEAIRTFTTAVEEAVQRNGGRPLGAADIDTIINLPQGFTGVDMTMEEFINQTYGLSTPVTTTEQREFNLLDRIGGRDQMARAEERLSRTPIIEGMTIQQVNQAALQGDYQSIMPGTFATFASDTSYDITEQGVEFMRDFNRILDDTVDSDRYNPVEILDRGITGEEAIAAEQNRILIEAVEPLITGYAQKDPVGFMRAHESQLRNRLGDAYVEQLKEQLGLSAPEPNEDGGSTGGSTGGSNREPEVQQPRDGQPEVQVEAPSLAMPSGMGGDAESFTEEEGTDVSAESPEMQRKAFAITGTDGNQYTYEDWQGMTRTQRIAAGLPTSVIGGEREFRRFQRGIGGMPSIDDIVGPAGEGDPEARADYEQLSEAGFDDMTIALLNSHGADMVQYLIQQGATTNEEMYMALTEWGRENNIVMPMDKLGLVNAMQSVIQAEQ